MHLIKDNEDFELAINSYNIIKVDREKRHVIDFAIIMIIITKLIILVQLIQCTKRDEND